jgi:hypothetical protein
MSTCLHPPVSRCRHSKIARRRLLRRIYGFVVAAAVAMTIVYGERWLLVYAPTSAEFAASDRIARVLDKTFGDN